MQIIEMSATVENQAGDLYKVIILEPISGRETVGRWLISIEKLDSDEPIPMCYSNVTTRLEALNVGILMVPGGYREPRQILPKV